MIKNSLRSKLSNFIKLQMFFVFITFSPLALLNLYSEKYFAALLDLAAIIIAVTFYFLDKFIGSTKIITTLVVYAYALVAAVSISEDKASALYWFFPIALFCLFLMQPRTALLNISFIFLCLPAIYILQFGFAHDLVLYFASGFVLIGFSYSFVLSGAKIEKLAITDHLTGLYNRRILEQFEDFIALWQLPKFDNFRFVAAVLDIDNFKEINDELGHQFGDECLIKLASILNELTEKHEELFAVRLGGDEFLVFGAIENIESIKRDFEIMSTFAMDLESVEKFAVHTSYGLLDTDLRLVNSSEALTEILNKADVKMYSKKHGLSTKHHTDIIKS